MGHGIMAKDVVRYCSLVTENKSSADLAGLLVDSECWWECQDPEEFPGDFSLEAVNALNKFNGWDLHSHTEGIGKKGRLWGWTWTKGERRVTFMNTSQYSNGDDITLHLVCDTPEDAMAFHDDNGHLWDSGFDLCEDEILELWG